MFPRHFGCLMLIGAFLLLWNNRVDGAMTQAQMENAAAGFRNVCVPKTGVDTEIVASYKTTGIFPEDTKFQCYIKCIMGLLKTIKNGRPQLDPILKQINLMMPAENQERSIYAATKCVNQDFSDDACVAAWQYIKCQYETAPEVFFFP